MKRIHLLVQSVRATVMVRSTRARFAEITVALVCGAVMSSCSGYTPASPTSTAPSSPSLAVPTGARTTTAASPEITQLEFSVELTIPPYPICSQTPPSSGTITGTGVLTETIRWIVDGAGKTHISTSSRGHGTATDALGTRWVWSDADLNSEADGLPTGQTGGNAFTETIRENFKAVAPGGQQIFIRGTFHITIVNGSPVVEFENGNHEEAEVCESGFVLTPLP